MNILFLFHYPIISKNGGVERVTSLLNKELSSRGHNVFFLSTRYNRDICENKLSNQYFVDYPNDRINAIKEYIDILRLKKIDYVINQAQSPETHALLKYTPQNIKKISVIHIQPITELRKERLIYLASSPNSIKQTLKKYFAISLPIVYRTIYLHRVRKLYKQLAEVSDKIVLLSEKFNHRILDNIPNFDSSKLVAINNPNTFMSVDNSTLQYKEKIILYVGRIENSPKNVIGFLKMWKYLYSMQQEWKAYIIGDGSDRIYCEDYVKKHSIPNVFFEGNQEDVASYYRKASFICLTSIYEGWGMVLTEGMAYGCIPVCFNSYESCYDIIEDGKDGIIAPEFDYIEMACRISSVIADPRKMERMSFHAKEKISKFDKSVIADEWENLFCQL